MISIEIRKLLKENKIEEAISNLADEVESIKEQLDSINSYGE